MQRSRLKVASALLAAFSLLGAACSSGSTTSPAAPAAPPPSTVAPAANGAVTAGAQIGLLPSAPAGWAPPRKITPINPPPGMFQSTGDAPAQPGAKVRVFFLGMQW
jgi:hypothetical protein